MTTIAEKDAGHDPLSSKEWKLVKRVKGPDDEWWSSTPREEARAKMFGMSDEAADVDVARAGFAHGYSLVIHRLKTSGHA